MTREDAIASGLIVTPAEDARPPRDLRCIEGEPFLALDAAGHAAAVRHRAEGPADFMNQPRRRRRDGA